MISRNKSIKETTKMINKFYKTQFDKKEKNTSKGEIYKKSKQRKQTKRKQKSSIRKSKIRTNKNKK